MYGTFKNYVEYVWAHIKDIGNIYGHIKKHNKYVLTSQDIQGICMET